MVVMAVMAANGAEMTVTDGEIVVANGAVANGMVVANGGKITANVFRRGALNPSHHSSSVAHKHANFAKIIKL
jgi:hypothetical protein